MAQSDMRMKAFYLFVACWATHFCFAQTPEDCDSLTQAANDETLVAWNSAGRIRTRRGADGPWQMKFGQLRTVAIVEDGQIREPKNAVLERGASLWNVLDPDQELILTDIYAVNYLFRPASSWCLSLSRSIWQHAVEGQLLFSPRRSRFRLRPATEAGRHHSTATCVRHLCGDHRALFLRDTAQTVRSVRNQRLIGFGERNRSREAGILGDSRVLTGFANWSSHSGDIKGSTERCSGAWPLCSRKEGDSTTEINGSAPMPG